MPALNFAFTKLVVADLAEAERFYADTLGLHRVLFLEYGESPDAVREVILAVPDSAAHSAKLSLIRFPNRPAPIAGEMVVGFTVDDLEATMTAMIAAGGKIAVPL